MELKRTSHAVYDTKYHLVWAPKYRKWVLRGDIRKRVGEIFEEVSRNHDFEIDTLEIAEDHVDIFLSFAPRYSISRVVGMLKSISASVIFEEHREVKRELWGGELWEDGYFVRTVGDKVTADVIRKYIKYHREQEKSPKQLELF
jgi:REP-associated tyrosine transposase